MKIGKISNLRKASRDQRGMAAIVITMVTMVVISLIVLGFAVLSRREQRNALDQQLSTQAFYAAESGVEDARSVINTAIKSNQPVAARTNCTNGGGYPSGSQMTIDAANQVAYTCLTVDPAPTSLLYDSLHDSSLVVPINTSQTISRIDVTWSPSSPPSGTPASCPATATNVFSPQSKWACGYGVLRADVVPTSGPLTRSGLTNSTLSGFFVPINSGAPGNLTYTATNLNKANLLAGNCTTGSYVSCTASLTMSGQTSVSLRLSSLYRTSNIKITAYHGTTPIGISGVQAVVDSTGKAVDVLRRIQVRLPVISTGGLLPSFAIQSNGPICKRFSTAPGYFAVAPDIAAPTDTSNAMCDSSSIDGSLNGGGGGTTTGGGGGTTTGCTANNDIVFALDASYSMSYDWNTTTRIAKLKAVATSFVDGSAIGPTGNNAAIVRFGKTASTLTGLSSNTTNLKSLINGISLDAPNSGTNYLPALAQVPGRYPTGSSRPKVLIFMSDGAPYDDKSQIRQQATDLKNSGVAIYTVGIGDHTLPYDQIDETLLKDMAGNGGTYGNANQPDQLTTILQGISDDLSCR